MFTTTAIAMTIFLGAASAVHAAVITLENTIPSGSLFLQPPVLTGAGVVFGNAGLVLADAFTAPVSAALSQISVVVQYISIPPAGLIGMSPMLLTLFTDSGDSPGTLIESWTVPLSPSDTSLTVITVDSVTHSLLLAGQQYWLSEVPTDPLHTGIGWGLASSGPPGIVLPIASTNTGVNSGWLPTNLNLANEFSVSGTTVSATVPEPATFGICGLAFLSMIVGFRAKARHSSASEML